MRDKVRWMKVLDKVDSDHQPLEMLMRQDWRRIEREGKRE